MTHFFIPIGEDEEMSIVQQGLFKSPAEIFNIVYKNVIDKKQKSCIHYQLV